MSFPSRRLRRLRSTPAMRDLVRESTIDPSDLVLPIFVQEGIDSPVEIKSMPEMRRLPVKDAASEVESAVDLGIPAVMLFGIPAAKDDAGSAAYDAKGAVQQAISQIRSTLGEKIVIMADVCLCQYTLSGHCGLEKKGKIDNDSSLGALARIAVSQAEAGVWMRSLFGAQMMDVIGLLVLISFTGTRIWNLVCLSVAKFWGALCGISNTGHKIKSMFCRM